MKMQKFLVISYDDDQQQWFYDFIAARSEQAAIKAVLRVRVYCQGADAVLVDYVTEWADELKRSSVSQLHSEWRETVAAHHSPRRREAKSVVASRYQPNK